MSPDTLQIRLPVAKTPDVTAAPTFTLDRPIEGTTIGIRHEGSWRSWMLIAGEWERFLERDGAKPVIVQTGERVGHEGEETRARVREWADSVDCAVSGLGTCGSCTSWSVSDAVARRRQAQAVDRGGHRRVRDARAQHGHVPRPPRPEGARAPLPARGPSRAEELREIAVEYYPRFLELLQVGK